MVGTNCSRTFLSDNFIHFSRWERKGPEFISLLFLFKKQQKQRFYIITSIALWLTDTQLQYTYFNTIRYLNYAMQQSFDDQPFASELKFLAENGFTKERKNVRLLTKTNGNLDVVVNFLKAQIALHEALIATKKSIKETKETLKSFEVSEQFPSDSHDYQSLHFGETDKKADKKEFKRERKEAKKADKKRGNEDRELEKQAKKEEKRIKKDERKAEREAKKVFNNVIND